MSWSTNTCPSHAGPAPIPIVGIVDRKSTRLNSSHPSISYAVFCLKKKKTTFIVGPVTHGNRYKESVATFGGVCETHLQTHGRRSLIRLRHSVFVSTVIIAIWTCS